MSSKKSSKNGFMRFCFSQQKNDSSLAGLSTDELVARCSSRWEKMTSGQKTHFQEYGQVNGGERLKEGEMTLSSKSWTMSAKALARKRKNEELRIEIMKSDIKDLVESALSKGTLDDTIFYVVSTNVFCITAESEAVPAELSLAKVSLREGVHGEVYHVFIEPGTIPRGYRADCMDNSRATHKIPLDFTQFEGDYNKILEDILEIVLSDADDIPPLYCLPKFFTQNKLVLDWIIRKSKTDLVEVDCFKMYSLPLLLFEMCRESNRSLDTSFSSQNSVSAVRNRVPTLSLAEAQLGRDTFMYMAGMCCDWHTRVETLYCSRAQCLGWVYILVSLVCPLRGLALLPATHLPAHLPAPAGPRTSLSSCALSSAASDDTRSVSEKSTRSDREMFGERLHSSFETSTDQSFV